MQKASRLLRKVEVRLRAERSVVEGHAQAALLVGWNEHVALCGIWLFTLFTLLAYLNYTPQLRYQNEDQIHYRSIAGPGL